MLEISTRMFSGLLIFYALIATSLSLRLGEKKDDHEKIAKEDLKQPVDDYAKMMILQDRLTLLEMLMQVSGLNYLIIFLRTSHFR